jgi:hypothetical protein
VIEQRGLASAEEAGEDGDGEFRFEVVHKQA